MMENGGRPVIRLEVKRSIARAGGRWLLQNVAGSFVSPRRMVSFKVRIVRSTCPFALLFPTVILLCAIPKAEHKR